MTRYEAAQAIETVLVDCGYSIDLWAPQVSNGPIRVYVTVPAESYKKKSYKIGYIEVTDKGEVESQLDKQSGTIMGKLPKLQIELPAPVVVIDLNPTKDHSLDEDQQAFESSGRRMNRAESDREQG